MEPRPEAAHTRIEDADAASTQALPPVQDPWSPGAQPPRNPWEPDPADDQRNHTLIQPWEPAPEAWQPAPESWQPAAESWQSAPQQGYIPPPSPPTDPWAPTKRPPRRNSNSILFAAAWVIVAVAAVAAGVIFFWPHHSKPSAHNAFAPSGATSSGSSPKNAPSSDPASSSPSATPSGPALSQATAVNSLLDSMAASRSEFANAMTQAEQCSNLGTAIPVIQKVVGERQSELSTAQSLQVGALPSGSQLKDSITRALQASLDADNAYLSWANNNQNCTGTTPQDGDYANGTQISTDRATPAKQDFIQLWTQVAQQYGQPPRDADHI